MARARHFGARPIVQHWGQNGLISGLSQTARMAGMLGAASAGRQAAIACLRQAADQAKRPLALVQPALTAVNSVTCRAVPCRAVPCRAL